MPNHKNIKIAISHFSPTPCGRYRSDGAHSGEAFREDVLVPALQKAMKKRVKIILDLNDIEGLPVGFLEEAFGGLVRAGFSLNGLKRHLRVKSDHHLFGYIQSIWQHIKKAESESITLH